MKRKKSSRPSSQPMRAYDTYLWKDKDPIIDILRALLVADARRQNISLERVMGQISYSGSTMPSYSCLHGWFFGKVQSPQFKTLEAVARYYGKTFSNLSDLGRRDMQFVNRMRAEADLPRLVVDNGRRVA